MIVDRPSCGAYIDDMISSSAFGRRRDAACIAALAALCCVFYEASLFRGRIFMLRDLAGDFGPWRTFAAQSLRRGVIPLWCPHNDCGAAFLATMETGVLYPPNWLFDWRDFGRAVGGYAALHAFLAAALMFAFVRALGVSAAGGLVAGAAYAFGGWMTAHLEFLPWFSSLAWRPLILLCAYKTVRAAASPCARRGWRWAAAWGAAAAVQFAAGYPEAVIFPHLVTALFILGFAAFHLRAFGARGLARAAGLCAAAGAVAATLSAAQLLPALELVRLSARGVGMDYAEAASRSVYPEHFLTWLVPRAFGGVGFHRYWGGALHEFGFACYYIGAVGAALAAVGVFAPRGRRRRWAAVTWAAIALAGMALAMGRFGPAHRWVFDHVPLIGGTRWPVKFMSLAVLAACVLAGMGADVVLLARSRRLTAFGLTAAAVVCLGLAALGADLWSADDPAATWAGELLTRRAFPRQMGAFRQHYLLAARDAFRAAALLALAAAAAALARRRGARRRGARWALPGALALDLLLVVKPINWTTQTDLYAARPPIPRRLAEEHHLGRVYVPDRVLFANNWLYGLRNPQAFLWAANALLASRATQFGLDAAYGDYSLDLGRTRRLLDLVESRLPASLERSRLLRLLNVRWIVDARGANIDALAHMQNYETQAFATPIESRRAWVVRRVRFLIDSEALMLMGSKLFDPDREAILPPEARRQERLPNRAAGGPGAARVERRAAHEVSVETAAGPGLLVLSATHYPGWRAFDGGRRTDVLRVDYALRGAWVKRGRRSLLFVFDPVAFKWGVAATLASFAALCAWAAASCARIRRVRPI